jgi:hypothetical protein
VVTTADRRSVLDATYVALASAERIQLPEEPPREVNAAYVALVFACGFAKLEATERARELQHAAQTTLAPLRSDPVHAWLAAAFDVVIGGGAAPQANLDELDRVTRYKLDRFREASRLVGGSEPIDAIMRFARHRWPDPDWDAGRVDHARAQLAAATDQDQLDYVVEDLLKANNDHLPRERAAEILDMAVAHAERVSRSDRAMVYAAAALRATHAAPERVVELAEQALPLIEAAFEFRVEGIVETLASAFERCPALAALWLQLPEVAHPTAGYTAGLIRLGDPRGLARYRASTGCVPALIRNAVLDHYLALPFEERFVEPWAVELYRRTSDDLATCSHFTMSVVALVDRIVRGVLDD